MMKIYDVRCQKGDSAFLLDDGKISVLYDTGFGFTGFAVAEKIKAILGQRKLDYIFLTHSHYDHALGSAYILRYYPEAVVVAGRYAAEIFRRDSAKCLMQKLDAEFARQCGITSYAFLGDELRVDLPVDDGDVITVGDNHFEVVNLPGHTNCSIGFLCREEGLFLSTETLGVCDGENVIVPCFLVGYASTLRSMERASKLKMERLLAPHYGLLNKEQTSFFLQNMRTATESVAMDMLSRLKQGESAESIIEAFKEKFWHGYIREIYPEDAINLNTSIMVKCIQKELLAE